MNRRQERKSLTQRGVEDSGRRRSGVDRSKVAKSEEARGEIENEDGAHGTPLSDLENTWVGWQSPALDVCPGW